MKLPDATHTFTLRVSAAEERAIKEAAFDARRSINVFLRETVAASSSHKYVCRQCGCTEADCRQCVEKTGEPCHWVEPDLCSACAPVDPTRECTDGTKP
jgi:hypothetical protein